VASDPKEPIRSRLRVHRDLGIERMFETRSEAWERVGLAMNSSERVVSRARREVGILLPLLIAVYVAWENRASWFGLKDASPWITPLRIATVLVLLVLGWWTARGIGRAAAPTFFRRMDPAMSGTIGFLIRFSSLAIVLFLALSVAGLDPRTLAVGGAFTAVIFGLAAQQTLGNLIAGMVLLSARPFRVGERVRLQAGAVGGSTEGVVSSLGLLYTTLARGEDRIMIPNNVVLGAAVMPLREPDSVDVKVRLSTGVRPSHVQRILDQDISVPTRSKAVLLEELDGDDVVVRVQATPDRASDGAKLADEIIALLASVTGEHPVVERDGTNGRNGSNGATDDDADANDDRDVTDANGDRDVTDANGDRGGTDAKGAGGVSGSGASGAKAN
jgi:small conductance mechanosensitive channel